MSTYTDEYSSDGQWIARTYANDPTNPKSWRDEYDNEGRLIARTYANDPAHPYSWRAEYDSDGRWIARTFACDPKHPGSWRTEYSISGTKMSNERKKIDWSKPVEFVDGNCGLSDLKVHADMDDSGRTLVSYRFQRGDKTARWVDEYGCVYDDQIIRNVPVKRELWIRWVRNTDTGVIFYQVNDRNEFGKVSHWEVITEPKLVDTYTER